MNAVNERFVLNKEQKINGYAVSINSHYLSYVIINNVRAWVANVFIGCFFKKYLRSEIIKDILKRVVIKGETVSSLTIKMFKRLRIIAIPKKKNVMDLMSS